MTIFEKLEYITAAAAAQLPALLTALSLDDFETYIADTPYDFDKRQFTVYLDTGKNNGYDDNMGIIVQAQLPGVEQPSKYLDPILDVLNGIKAGAIGFTAKEEIEWAVWYPGESPLGGGAAFIHLRIEYSRSLDDCE